MARKICEKCHRQMEDTRFYTYHNGQKPQMCKACMTMHVDNFNPDTFLWILQKMDVPYVPEEWNKIRDAAYAKDPRKMNGMSVVGKYLSKMKLKQFKDYRWEDSAALQQKKQKQTAAELEQKRAAADLIREQYERGQISQAQYRTLVSTEYQKEHEYIIPPNSVQLLDPIGANNAFNQNNFMAQSQLPDLTSQLTLEDKQYLAVKWGRTYKISEWVELQKIYTQMMNSFDIQDADSKNTLIFICKTILKMNQALDCGDVDGYQKLSRVYDALRKSANFTKAQNKEEKGQFIDSIGQLVAYCQKNGHQIPKYEIKTPYDIIDKIIDDLKGYTKSLIYEDSALARQIEDYIKEAKAAAEKRRDRAQAKEKGLQAPEISDEDILAFKDFIKSQQQESLVETLGDRE